MNRDLLKLINGFVSLQTDRDAIKLELEKEIKAQRMCSTQLKNLEKKLTEKMERRDEMLNKYNEEFAVELAKFKDSFVVFDESRGANFECTLFDKRYVLFRNRYFLSSEAIQDKSILVEEIAKEMVNERVGVATNSCFDVESLIKLDKEIKKNPTIAKEKLVAREVKNREESIKSDISEIKTEILQDEELLQHYNSKLEGKEPVKNTLLNKLFKRNQLKAQKMVEKLTNGISLNYTKIDGYTEQLGDKETIKEEAKSYVDTQLELIKDYIEILNYLDAIKGKLEAYNRRYVAPIQEQIEQTKTAIKSSETMQTLHKAELKGNAEEIDDFLISRYQDSNLVEKLLNISKKDCTPEQWKTISLIKNHYNENVAKTLDGLLN